MKMDWNTVKKKAKHILAKAAAAFLGVAVLVASPYDVAAQNLIKEIRTGHQNDGIRIVLDGSEDFDYDAFLLDSPNRLVIDLKDTAIKGSPEVEKNRLISDFRIGNKPDIKGKRLVFEIKNNVNIKKKFTLKPQAGQKNWRLVIDLSTQGLSDPSDRASQNAKSAANRKRLSCWIRDTAAKTPAPSAAASALMRRTSRSPWGAN